MPTDDEIPKSLSDGAKKEGAGSSLNVIDEEQLRSLWQRGREAWAGVANATEWLEQLRGSDVHGITVRPEAQTAGCPDIPGI